MRCLVSSTQYSRSSSCKKSHISSPKILVKVADCGTSKLYPACIPGFGQTGCQYGRDWQQAPKRFVQFCSQTPCCLPHLHYLWCFLCECPYPYIFICYLGSGI